MASGAHFLSARIRWFRSTASVLVLLLLALSGSGPLGSGLFQLRQEIRGRTVAARLQTAEALPDGLQVFWIPDAWAEAPPEGFRWKHTREFVCQGVFYDIASKTRGEGGWHCTVFADHVDGALEASARAHVAQQVRRQAAGMQGTACCAQAPAPHGPWLSEELLAQHRPDRASRTCPPAVLVGVASAPGPRPWVPPPRRQIC